MTLPHTPAPSESTTRLGVLEAGLLAVIGLLGLLITGGAVVAAVASLVLGGTALELPE